MDVQEIIKELFSEANSSMNKISFACTSVKAIGHQVEKYRESLVRLKKANVNEAEQNERDRNKILLQRNNLVSMESCLTSLRCKSVYMQRDLLDAAKESTARDQLKSKVIKEYRDKLDTVIAFYGSTPLTVRRDDLDLRVQRVRFENRLARDKMADHKRARDKYREVTAKKNRDALVTFASFCLDHYGRRDLLKRLKQSINENDRMYAALMTKKEKIFDAIRSAGKKRYWNGDGGRGAGVGTLPVLNFARSDAHSSDSPMKIDMGAHLYKEKFKDVIRKSDVFLSHILSHQKMPQIDFQRDLTKVGDDEKTVVECLMMNMDSEQNKPTESESVRDDFETGSVPKKQKIEIISDVRLDLEEGKRLLRDNISRFRSSSLDFYKKADDILSTPVDSVKKVKFEDNITIINEKLIKNNQKDTVFKLPELEKKNQSTQVKINKDVTFKYPDVPAPEKKKCIEVSVPMYGTDDADTLSVRKDNTDVPSDSNETDQKRNVDFMVVDFFNRDSKRQMGNYHFTTISQETAESVQTTQNEMTQISEYGSPGGSDFGDNIFNNYANMIKQISCLSPYQETSNDENTVADVPDCSKKESADKPSDDLFSSMFGPRGDSDTPRDLSAASGFFNYKKSNDNKNKRVFNF